jgi:4-amino-4-deoxy-L-arabinose transferase-like glycosyltransferase
MRSITVTEEIQTAASAADGIRAEAVGRGEVRSRATWIAPALVLLGVGLFGFATLLNYPVTFVDEGWAADRAWSLLQTGHQFASVDSGVYQRYEGYWTYWPYLGTLIHAVFIWLFGLSLAAIRLASIFFGLILLTTVYCIVRRLYSHKAAVIAMALLAVSSPFIYTSHMARHDIIVAALGFGAIALYATDEKSSLSIKSILSGLTIALALDIHPNALIYGPIMLALFLLDYRKNILRTGRFWGFVLGGTLGVLYFVAMHILPYPQTYFALAALGGASHTPPGLTLDPSLWQWSLIHTFDFLDLLLLPVIVPAMIFLIRRQSRSDIRVLALFGISVVSMAAIIQTKAPFYAILIAPTLPLMMAPYLEKITEKVGKITEWTFWRNLIVIGIIVVVGCINLYPAIHGNDEEYQKVLGYLKQTIPDGSLVYGSPTYWFAMKVTRYVNWEQILVQQKSTPSGTFSGAVETIKPDYLIVDGFMTEYTLDDDWCHANFNSFACIPKAELKTLLKEDATLAGEMKTGNFGDVRIYKMNWASTRSGAGR